MMNILANVCSFNYVMYLYNTVNETNYVNLLENRMFGLIKNKSTNIIFKEIQYVRSVL